MENASTRSSTSFPAPVKLWRTSAVWALPSPGSA